jgi:hypothetical protein
VSLELSQALGKPMLGARLQNDHGRVLVWVKQRERVQNEPRVACGCPDVTDDRRPSRGRRAGGKRVPSRYAAPAELDQTIGQPDGEADAREVGQPGSVSEVAVSALREQRLS